MNLEDSGKQPFSEGRMKRRGFINLFLGGGLIAAIASIIYPVFSYLVPPKAEGGAVSSVKAASIDELKPESARIFKFGSKPGLLLRLKNGEYRAFIAVCTHLSCTVQYRKDMDIIWCACHNGKYNLQGINIAGPPPRPLEVLDVHVRGNDIYVSRVS
jgi:Rieske Fe-S protein